MDSSVKPPDKSQSLRAALLDRALQAGGAGAAERLLRKMNMTIQAKNASLQIQRNQDIQRQMVKEDLMTARKAYLTEMYRQRRERDDRWTKRLSGSPFSVDLVADLEKVEEVTAANERVRKSNEAELERRYKATRDEMFRKAVEAAETVERARTLRRSAAEADRLARAHIDIEKSTRSMEAAPRAALVHTVVETNKRLR
uniref:Uncharacterized protein n=1 Tax=Chromera velia CCMP2878 TaxID=1169474 RepID=A0A0G4I5Y1_9ALVE|eukprot:Cvel_11255.t1-p1 / transcript=Cvel_11255.t1 / gene=Cvel_11255 / organism=Chromera_velia_CCMP2878 / gene_product=hypothetical protein / transcript_product=hypothetical protein / location=Cvel_scaffold701:69783-70376(-) / protein_length=198 / sequence_SO=supercontig / SO=protein_coding / is_pseudo=false